MRNKKHKNQKQGSGGFRHLAHQSEFYSGSPVERPLYSDRPETDPLNSRKTLRHQQLGGGRKEKSDPREKAALFAILKAAITLSFLVILFFMLWKGIKLYEESIYMENEKAPELSPVLKELATVEGFDISENNGQAFFSDRIKIWSESDRLVRNVQDLLLRGNVDEAIDRCQQALKLDPSHIGALEYLGDLYLQQGMYVEAVNTYMRLLNLEPSRTDYQLELLKSLDAYGDSDAIIVVAQWYQSRNLYDGAVQRYLANAYFALENYDEAAKAYERALKDAPRDVAVLDNLSVAYMRLEQYDQALATLERLVEIEFRDPIYHKRLVMCLAQLGRAEETVQVMGKSAHLFGADTVAMWIQDPMMDPIRMNHTFRMFADTVVTEEYRKYLEEMARAVDRKPVQEIGPRLDVPESDALDAKLLESGQPTQPEQPTQPGQ